ncbi:MAG TPA: GHMP kinase [Candidatus Methylomirabilis sp.]|nr:GHMP kinase [Candidatus Methylomirabilis sp.]
MVISRTPLRLSFVGGGSDLPAFYRRQPGALVSTAISKYIYIAVNKKFDRKIRASYSVTEIVDHVDELKHELIREALRLVGLEGGIEITSISDIPSEGTGLGSSGSYTVGLLKALYGYVGRHVGAERLAREACHIEIDICRKPIGKQDQYIAAYGGLQYVQFNSDESVFVDPVICSPGTKQDLQRMLLLFYTGLTRSADDVLAEQRRNTETREDVRRALEAMVTQARELRDALVADDVTAFGEILHQGWLAKKKMADGITNARIDEWYERARQHGAIGGKIAGAGGGGFLLLCAPAARHDDVRRALPELTPMAFRFEPQGSKIVFMEEEE